MRIKDKYEFKNKFDSMTGGSSDTELETIISKCKRECRTYAGGRRGAEKRM